MGAYPFYHGTMYYDYLDFDLLMPYHDHVINCV